jgi:glyoxylase-like metal-dependent hydrolase (beta-lactamase superfamily II)
VQTETGDIHVWLEDPVFPERGVCPTEDGDWRIVRATLDGRTEREAVSSLTLGLAFETSAAVEATYLGSWTSPTWANPRHAMSIYALKLPERQSPRWAGTWVDVGEALRGWGRGTIYLGPVLFACFRHLADRDPGQPSLGPIAFSAQPGASLEVLWAAPDVAVLPLLTPTLPPATHTNCVVFAGAECTVVDPASALPQEVDRLVALLQTFLERGARVARIVLTHHHRDHVGGVAALREHFDAPVVAHRNTAELLAGWLDVDELIQDGDRLPCGDRSLSVLHTPGHASGHVVVWDERSGVAAFGDMIAGQGTIVIDPPDGDMALYLTQLERLERLGVRVAVPSHGPLVTDPAARLHELRRHRVWREGAVLEALRTLGPCSVEDLMPMAYGDVPKMVRPIAVRQVLAHVEKLATEGRARRVGGKLWEAT